MKILYDYQAFYMQRFGGISNAFISLMKNLPEDASFELGIKDSENVHLMESDLVPLRPLADFDNFLGKGYFWGKGHMYKYLRNLCPSIDSGLYNKKYSIELLEKGNYDVFHPTFFDDYFLPHLHGKPYVLTIYDMITEKFFPENNMQTINKRELVKSASHIMAISDKTKEDIIEILHVPEHKITTIYLAAPDVLLTLDSRPMVSGDYILFVGNRERYKNFIPMLKALIPVLNRHKRLKLVCTGSSFSPFERHLIDENKLSDKVIQLSPSDQELRTLYSNATCFIYPSLYEGFGIPILEAWSCQCPVLLNNKSCFPEIARDAAIYFDLDNDHSDLADVMESFLSMSDLDRNKLLDRQKARLSYFSWKKSAMELYDVYRLVTQ